MLISLLAQKGLRLHMMQTKNNLAYGFTLIEVLLAVTITAMLALLATNSLTANQRQARDAERRSDISSLARLIEDWYKTAGAGRYPSTAQLANNDSWASANLRGIDMAILRAPRISTNSIVAATNTTATTAGVLPQPTVNSYVYQPLTRSGTLCTDASLGCIRYELYYRQEANNAVIQSTSMNR